MVFLCEISVGFSFFNNEDDLASYSSGYWICFSLDRNLVKEGKTLIYRVFFNDRDKVNTLKTFFWFALIILIIFFMDNYLVHFDNKL